MWLGGFLTCCSNKLFLLLAPPPWLQLEGALWTRVVIGFLPETWMILKLNLSNLSLNLSILAGRSSNALDYKWLVISWNGKVPPTQVPLWMLKASFPIWHILIRLWSHYSIWRGICWYNGFLDSLWTGTCQKPGRIKLCEASSLAIVSCAAGDMCVSLVQQRGCRVLHCLTPLSFPRPVKTYR